MKIHLRFIPSLLLVVATFLVGPRVVFAADPVAESMFQEGVDLMKEGRFGEACPKLEASQKLEPKSGTLLTLANCSEQIGKTATAWAQYKEAAGLARKEGREDYADKATELASQLEPKLSKLRIDAQVSQGGVELTVELDGKTVLSGTFGVAFAIDPGTHEVVASAPGRQTWSTTVAIGPAAGNRVVAVPQLEQLHARSQPSPPTPEPTVTPPPDAPEAPAAEIPVWAWIAGAVGLAAIGGSVAFAVDQRSAANELDSQCGGESRGRCPLGYDFEADHAREQRDFGLFVGLGALGLAGLGVGVAGIVIGTSGVTEPSDTGLRLVPIIHRHVVGVAVHTGF